jgi:hypothetical protein
VNVRPVDEKKKKQTEIKRAELENQGDPSAKHLLPDLVTDSSPFVSRASITEHRLVLDRSSAKVRHDLREEEAFR